MIVMKFVLAANHKLIFYVVQISIIDTDMLLDWDNYAFLAIKKILFKCTPKESFNRKSFNSEWPNDFLRSFSRVKNTTNSSL